MSPANRILLVLEEGLEIGPIREALPTGAPVGVAPLAEAAEANLAALDETAPDLVVVGCREQTKRALRLIEETAARRPDSPIVVLYEGSPNGFLDVAFEAGADDLIALPQTSEDLRFALAKAIARRRGTLAPPGAAPMIAVLGPKGGSGKTLTAANLAIALALAGRRPVLVDLDLQFGDVGLALGLKPERTIYDLAVSGGSLDADKVDSFLMEHTTGARALLAPLRPDQAAAIGISFLDEVYEILRDRYDFVIVDTPPAFTPEVIAAIDGASHLCVVGMLDALSLKAMKIAFETLAQMGYDPDQTVFVLNRADTNVGITQVDVRQLLGRFPDLLVPSDRAIPRAITVGQPIVLASPRSGPARAFSELADRYIEARVAETARDSVTSEQRGERRRRRALLRKGS